MDVLIDVTSIAIETDRLLLRAFEEGDLEDFYAYASVPGVGEAAGWPHHASVDVSRRILSSFLAEKEVFALYHKAGRKVIGSLGIHRSWANEDERYQNLRVKELGYVLAKDYWGKGLMTEAARAAIGYGFETLGLEAFTCGHFTENARSRRVIGKCGFRFVATGEFYASQLGRAIEDQKYILLREDWASAPAPM